MTSKLTNNLISWDKYLLLLTLLVLAIVPVWGRLIAAPITIIEPCSDYPESCKFQTATDIPVKPTYAERIAARFKLDDVNEEKYCPCARAWYDTAVKIQDAVRNAGIDFHFDRFEILGNYYVVGSGDVNGTRSAVFLGMLNAAGRTCNSATASFYDGTYDDSEYSDYTAKFSYSPGVMGWYGYSSTYAFVTLLSGNATSYELLGKILPCCSGMGTDTSGTVPLPLVTTQTCPMATYSASYTPWSVDRILGNRLLERRDNLTAGTGAGSSAHCLSILSSGLELK